MYNVAVTELPFPVAFGFVIGDSCIELQFLGGLIIDIDGKGVNVGIILGDIAYGPKLGR